MDGEELAFSVRIGGRPAASALHEGLPDWLVHPLMEWLQHELRPWSVRQIALRLRIALAGSEEPAVLCDELMNRAATPEGRWDLLDAIAYLVTMEFDDLAIPSQFIGTTPISGTEPLSQLNYILERGGSVYRVGKRRLGLERRVDEPLTATIDRAATAAGSSAGEHLRRVWDETYGLHPDPTAAYREAVLAVEAVACPLILPAAPKPTLGTVIIHLKETPNKWAIAIPDKKGNGSQTGVAALVAMLELLWTGQVSRHAGSPTSRDQLQIEAEAALPLAATLVHWFATGVVRRAGNA